jgi:hypothetical protein
MYLVLGLAVLVLLWYFFRPERLFINKPVEEPPPHAALTPHLETTPLAWEHQPRP